MLLREGSFVDHANSVPNAACRSPARTHIGDIRAGPHSPFDCPVSVMDASPRRDPAQNTRSRHAVAYQPNRRDLIDRGYGVFYYFVF